MKTLVLLDLENVHPAADEFAEFARTDARLAIFHGSHQIRFDADMVKALQPLGTRIEYVQCARNGKNALDFVIAYHLGRLSASKSKGESETAGTARFVIVSKDGDFDSLIEYANSNGLVVSRVASLREALGSGSRASTADAKIAAAPKSIPAVAVATDKPGNKATPATKKAAATANDIYKKIVDNLRTHPKNRPSTRGKLEKHLATIIGKATSLPPAKAITRLAHDKHLSLAEDAVTYHFE